MAFPAQLDLDQVLPPGCFSADLSHQPPAATRLIPPDEETEAALRAVYEHGRRSAARHFERVSLRRNWWWGVLCGFCAGTYFVAAGLLLGMALGASQ